MKVCLLGGARYSQPLDKTAEKKFRLLKSVGEMFVIGFSQDFRLRKFSEHAHFYLLPKFPLPFVRYIEMFTLGPLLALWLVLRHGIQVLIAQSPYEGAVAAVAKNIAGCLGRRVVLVVESHGDFEEGLFLQRRIYLPTLYRFFMRHAARFALRHADLLRAISSSTRMQLERWRPGRPVVQFPTWTDIDVFLQSVSSEKQGSSQNIVYAGVLTPLKGIHHLINAFAQIAGDFLEAGLIIVGKEENRAYAAGLKEQARSVKLDGRIKFTGQVPQVELAVRMRQACVFVLPSASEGLGRVVVEAMATGTPVVGSNVGGIAEVIEDGVTGFLVPPGNETALAQRLRWVLEHPESAQEIGRRAHAFAQRFLSTESYVGGYRRVLEEARKTIPERGNGVGKAAG